METKEETILSSSLLSVKKWSFFLC